MAKRTKKEKELAQLRREAEILKAQLKTTGKIREIQKNKKEEEDDLKKLGLEVQSVDPKYIKSDLIKAGVLTLISVGIITLLYLLRNQIPLI